MIVRSTIRPAEEHFTFAGGLLRAHIADGVPLDRLAAEYGMSLPRLRDRLAAYVATCAAALEEPEAVAPPPAPTPPAPPPLRLRVRERIEAPTTVPVPCSSLKRGMAGVAARQRKAADQDAALRPIIAEVRAAGAVTLSEIARALTRRGVATLRGGKWSATQVRRVQDRTTHRGLPCL